MASASGYELPDAIGQQLLRTVFSLAAHDNRSALEWVEDLTSMHPHRPLRRAVAEFMALSASARLDLWKSFSLGCLALKLADACDVLGGHHHHSTVCLELEALVSASAPFMGKFTGKFEVSAPAVSAVGRNTPSVRIKTPKSKVRSKADKISAVVISKFRTKPSVRGQIHTPALITARSKSLNLSPRRHQLSH